ncbi:MAG: molybdopterin-dependent oxidoreductase [Anaerolineaceae bacterium]|nr:molybdopterin-dependent oxidoreductase [Anaerolineaceae bacterium]
MKIKFSLNLIDQNIWVNPDQTLLNFLREKGLKSVKSGCGGQGDCGMCVVLINNKPVKSCLIKMSAIDGKSIETLESLGTVDHLHPLQRAFIETGAIQCGFCTPAQILTAKSLISKNNNPSEVEIRKSLSRVLCRCTGYVRIVDAVSRASAIMRGEEVPPYIPQEIIFDENIDEINLPEAYYRKDGNKAPLLPLILTPRGMKRLTVVGKPVNKVDSVKLATGKPVFTDDISLNGMLYGALLTSPHAHAKITSIDVSKAKQLPGVHAVITYKDIPRVKYATGGQSFPQPLPHDQVSLDNKVRHVGDRVAIVAAETQEIADKALQLIDVEYEILPHVLDCELAMSGDAPIIHDEEDTEGIFDASRNIVHHIEAEVGDPDTAFNDADKVFTGEYRTPKQQHAQMEPHICITYFDEDNRLVVRSSTQVPFHVRRIISPLIGLPIKQIRVIKPRIGGGFGGKQEVLLEDLCSHLTIATKRPVKMEYTRKQEFTSGRSRHRQIIRYKIAVKNEKVTAAELNLIGDTGAYGTHALTVNMVGGFKGLTLYNAPNSRFICNVVYTNTPPAGAYRGYGAMQEQFAIEVLMEEIAEQLRLDVVEFKKKNWLKMGELMHLARKLGEGKEGYDQAMASTAIDECVTIGLKATDYYEKRRAFSNESGDIRHGIGMSVMIHGSGIAGLDMGAATIKLNDDGSFNLLIGATDLGTGSDTILAQMAAEKLGVGIEDIIVYSSDTDFTPFDKGAYASSTTYISGGAVVKAAEKVKEMILQHAAKMMRRENHHDLILENKLVKAPDGKQISLEDIALSSLHQLDQHQIMATESNMSYVSPPPTGAQFAEVTFNKKTGEVQIDRLLMIVDCGRVINPLTAAGQVEGGMAQALGFTMFEDTYFDDKGKITNDQFRTYKLYKADNIPPMDVIFVQTDEPTGPYGAKSVAEISVDGVAPALVNALHNASGIWFRDLPITKDKILKGLQTA